MIQVLNRALNILELVAKNPKKTHTLTEIAEHLDINSSTCANIIKTLVNRNYLEQVSKKRGYRLGSMAYYITNNFSYKTELIKASKQPMKKLTKATNEGCILAILRGEDRIIINEEKSKNELQVVNPLKKNTYATSTGRLILSFLNKNELEKYTSKYGLPSNEIWRGINSFEDLYEETKKIREKRICFQESRTAHILGIAVPIWRGNKVEAALGIYMPSMRLTEEIRDTIITQLKDTGKKINENLEDMQDMHNIPSADINK